MTRLLVSVHDVSGLIGVCVCVTSVFCFQRDSVVYLMELQALSAVDFIVPCACWLQPYLHSGAVLLCMCLFLLKGNNWATTFGTVIKLSN